MSSDELVTSPLDARHREMGAKMADFAGWSMPVDYPGAGVLAEHEAVRRNVGVFDVSHLGTVRVEGPGAAQAVNRCLSNDLGKIAPGRAQYTLCCDETTGGVIDDMIVYLRSPSALLLVPNCANSTEVVRLLRAGCPPDVTITDHHQQEAIIAVQGPRSADVLAALGLPTPETYMAFEETTRAATPITVCRSGYTGELGFELVVDSAAATPLWHALIEAMAPHAGRVCGLGARDTLRMEMGYPLWGRELSREITPVMARLGWAVGWDKPAFWGREALLAQRAAKSGPLATGLVVTGRGVPRSGCRVRSADGTDLGVVTSGTMSPTLRQGIALALLARSAQEGDEVVIDVRGKEVPARVQRPPFVAPEVSG